MRKVWFIEINGNKEGPFSFEELKRDYRITPDTLVWKKGFKEWLPIRKVPELKKLFKDPEKDKGLKTKDIGIKQSGEQLTITLEQDPTPYFFIIILLLLVILYFIIKIWMK